MAVIYTFPTKGTPLGADLVLISDSEDDNNTKNATIASMVASNAIDVVDTVTASGAGITASPNKGNVVIANTGVLSASSANAALNINGPAGAITFTSIPYSGGTGIGHVPVGGTNSTFLKGDGTWGSLILPLATDSTRGGVKVGYVQESTRDYPVKLYLERMYVDVPWTDTPYIIPAASVNNLGGIKVYENYLITQPIQNNQEVSNRNYGITLNTDNRAFVNVPWIGGSVTSLATVGTSGVSTLNSGVLNIPNYTFTLNTANSSFLGGIKSYINYEDPQTVQLISNTSNRNYGIGINSDQKAFVNVPWSGLMDDWKLSADSGTTEVITNNVTVEVQGGTGVSTAVSSGGATDKKVIITNSLPFNRLTLTSTTGSDSNIVNNDTITLAAGAGITTTNNGSGQVTIGATTITASQGLTKNSNNITLDIADPDTGWAILGGGAGASTPVILGLAGINSTGTKNFGITTFTDSASVTSANSNVAMGFDSMGTTISTASNNVVLGSSAGNTMTTATQNTIVGGTSGQGLTTGQENTIIGDTAASALTTGTRNTIMGAGAQAGSGANTDLATAIGRGSTATTQSTAIGSGASVTGATGTALGNDASVAATNGIAIGMNCSITDPVLGLASAGNPIQTISSLSDAEIDKYLTVVVNGETRYIALYTGNP